MQNNSIALQEEEGKSLFPAGFFKSAMTLLTSPGKFFSQGDFGRDYRAPLQFLLICSIVSTLLSSIFIVDNQLLLVTINFTNAFIMPFITSAILCFLINLIFQKGLSYSFLLSITAYASVTLLFSWIPGLSLFVGVWHYCLIGIGLTKAASLSTFKTSLLILASLFVLLAFMKLTGVIMQ